MKKEYIFVLAIVFIMNLTACKSTKEASESKQEEKKNYVGWVNTSLKEVSEKKGLIQIKIKPGLGTYNIAVENIKGKIIPCLSTVEEYTTNSIYLKTGKKTYRLLADNQIKTEVSKTDNTIALNYSIANTADVTLSFEFIKSSEKSDIDMLKATVTVKNTGSRKDEFSVKQIFDTVLGESTVNHFYTSDGYPVKNEVMYRDSKEKKWIESKNNSASMQMLFTGGDTTVPQIVALANYSTLSKNGWEPDMLSFRTFDTVLSYNNSAVGVIWPSVKLLPKESKDIVYYLAFATDDDKPNGQALVYGSPVASEEIPVISEIEFEKTDKNVEESEFLVVSTLPPVKKDVYTPKDVPAVDFNVNNLSKEQFTPEYIQSLLDRINLLEQNSSSVNREELLRLNVELDAILSALR